MLLDVDLITERRRSLGLSARTLAKRINRSITVVRLLEQGTNHPEFSLGTLELLADALSVPMHRLLLAPDPLPSRAGPDDVKVENALAHAGKGVAAKDLARALDWKLGRVRTALDALRNRLAGTGQELHQHAGKWRLVPTGGVLSTGEVTALERRLLAHDRISIYDAAILLAVARGKATPQWLGRARNAQTASIARLQRLRYVVPTERGLELSDPVRASLGF